MIRERKNSIFEGILHTNNRSVSLKEGHYDTDKPVAASIKDLCDYINSNYHSMFTVKVDSHNGSYPKLGGNKLIIYMYGSSNESEAEEYLAKVFKDVVAKCHADISGFDIEMIDYIGFSGIKFELTIDSNAMKESRSLDIGDIPNIPDTTEKDVSSETKLNQAFNDEFDKKIKENAEVLKSYNEYEALKALKAAYEQLPEQLTVADLSDVVHIFNICYSSPVRDKECKEKLWAEDKTFVNATCDIIGAWKHQLTGAEYDAAVKKHPFLTKLSVSPRSWKKVFSNASP
jgi:hypothetical protein